MHNLGQYLPLRSLVHKLDPRVKLLAVVALSIMILFADIAELISVCILILAVSRLGKIGWGMLLCTSRPVLPFLAVLFLIYVLFTPGSPLLPFSTGPLPLSHEGLSLGIFQVSRFLLLVWAAAIFTMSTSPSEITMGLERLLRPLKLIGISSHNVAFMVTLALRFVPTLQEDIRLIGEAQLARGAGKKSGHLLGKISLLIYTATPLTFSILRRSDELVDAMEARGYQPGPRTYLRELSMTRLDYSIVVLIVMILIVLIGRAV